MIYCNCIIAGNLATRPTTACNLIFSKLQIWARKESDTWVAVQKKTKQVARYSTHCKKKIPSHTEYWRSVLQGQKAVSDFRQFSNASHQLKRQHHSGTGIKSSSVFFFGGDTEQCTFCDKPRRSQLKLKYAQCFWKLEARRQYQREKKVNIVSQ